MAKKPTKPTKTIKEWEEALEKLTDAEDFDTLLEQAEICIMEFPKSPIGYSAKAEAATSQNNYIAAIKSLDKVIELKPDSANAYNRRGFAKLNLRLGHNVDRPLFLEADSDFDKALEIDPEFKLALKNKAAFKSKTEDAVTTSLQKVEEQFQKGHWGSLFSNAKILFALRPDLPEGHFYQYVYYSEERPKLSSPYSIEGTLQLDENFQPAYLYRGKQLVKKNRYEDAIPDFSKVLEFDSQHFEARENRALCYLKTKKYDQAIEDCQICIERNLNSPNVLSIIGQAFLKLEKLSEALNAFQLAIEYEEGNYKHYNWCNDVYFKLGDYKSAINMSDKSISLNPDDVNAYYQQALSYQMLKEYELSLSFFEKAIVRAPRNPTMLVARARLFKELDRIDEAMEDLRQAQAYNPLFKNIEAEQLQASIIAETKVSEIETKLTKKFDEQLEHIRPVTDASEIIKQFESDINHSYKRLFEKNGLEDIAEKSASRLRGWLFLLVIFFIIFHNFNFTCLNISCFQLPSTTDNTDTLASFLRSSIYLAIMVLPFLLYMNKKKIEAKEELVRYHSLRRDRNILLFWSAQISDVKNTLSPEMMAHMATNSTADVSLRMMDRPLFSRKSGKEEIPLRADDVLKALKNLTLKKSE